MPRSGTCPCGLRTTCPQGQQVTQPLTCPIWQAHVRPSLWERIVGTIAALLMGRWR